MPIGRQVLQGKPILAAGQRDKYVLIQQATDGTTKFPTQVWTDLGHEYMSRKDLRADESFSDNQLSAFGDSQWHLGYRSDMDPDLVDVAKKRRLVYSGRTFDILSASLMDRKQGIELITLAQMRAPA